jgi:hypothetical protein
VLKRKKSTKQSKKTGFYSPLSTKPVEQFDESALLDESDFIVDDSPPLEEDFIPTTMQWEGVGSITL